MLAPMPAATMTTQEAAQINARLAFSICVQIMIDRVSPRAAFGAAGFTYRAIDRGVNTHGVVLGLDHYFEAPADTAKAKVPNPDQMAGICTVYSKHIPEATLASIVASEAYRRSPATTGRGATQWSIPTSSGLPLIVSVSTITNRHRYEPAGTVQVSMSFPG